MAQLKTKEIKRLDYERPTIDKGYANQTLYVGLSESDISIKPVTDKMKAVFIGGKGFDLWLLWNAVKGITKWNDPENEICIASGALGGTPIYPGSGKSIVTTISPTTGSVMDSNVGGYFGPYLKFCGFDALEVQGKTSTDVVIYIDGIDQKIQLLEPIDECSPVTQFLKKRGGGLHHLCFEVDDIEEITEQLTKRGFSMVREPVECVGYDRSFKRKCTQPSKIAFFLLPNKILIEFLQKGT